jgi:phage baseplate assembly protein W
MMGTDRYTGKLLTGEAYFRQAISFVLGTPIGSMVMQRDFGSNLFKLLGPAINGEFQLKALSYTSEAVQKWLPQIKIHNTAIKMAQNHVFEADIEYRILPKSDTKLIEGLKLI